MTRWIDADELKDWGERVPLTGDGGIDINDFDEKLASMPAADVAPVRHGRWLDYIGRDLGIEGQWRRNDGKTVFIQCSECDALVIRNLMVHLSYCPNCGAKMDKEGE